MLAIDTLFFLNEKGFTSIDWFPTLTTTGIFENSLEHSPLGPLTDNKLSRTLIVTFSGIDNSNT